MNKLASALLLAALGAAEITIDPSTKMFRDDEGRARIFHGQNVVVKLPPYLPTTDKFDPFTSMVDEDFQNMQNWGVKIVRLGVMWEAVEKSPGVYDHDYLNTVESMIKKFGDYGIYTLVDNHQDMFSRKLCGEGVPHFYTPKELDDHCPLTPLGIAFHLAGQCVALRSYHFEEDADGLPLISECQKHDFF
jgi:endoglycosylceramidase